MTATTKKPKGLTKKAALTELESDILFAAKSSGDIADSIRQIVRATEALQASGLVEDGIVRLLRGLCSVPAQQIKTVLRVLPELTHYLQDTREK